MNAYFEIAYAAASGRLCLFTGTGFSKAVTGGASPSWQSLLSNMCALLSDGGRLSSALFPTDRANPLPLEEAAQVIEIEFHRNKMSLHDAIAEHISSFGLSCDNSPIEQFLVGKSVNVVTTNYDKLFEALIEAGGCHSLAPGLPVPRSYAPISVYHVHGSIDSPRQMVVTSDDYFQFLNGDSYFSRKLSTILYENTVVILGYSLADTNLKSILSEYKGFSRSNFVGANIFLVSRSAVAQYIKDYYAHSFGIRVLDRVEIHEFFKNVSHFLESAQKCATTSKQDIQKVLYQNHYYKDEYLRVSSSFLEIIASISAVGISINSQKVVDLIGRIIEKKTALTTEYSAWDQYTQLADWLIYLCSILELRKTSIEAVVLNAVLHSLTTMSSDYLIGYSWHAFRAWSTGWESIIPSNRAIISAYVESNCSWPDALSVVRSV